MSDELRTIRLYGYLGARFGRVHRLAVASTAEAVQALCVVLPGFEHELMTSKDRGVGYACFLGRRNLGEDRLNDPAGGEDIRIAPIVQGSKRGGLFTLVLGAALFFVAPYLVNPATATLLGEGGAIAFGAGVASAGKLLMLSGVIQAISPQQKGVSTQDGPDNGASYNFNGPVNTTAQGNPVPVIYGELFIGSATVSAGIHSEDQQ
ncbi:tail assembly protein [Comamonas terrigena]|uniref:tail assembly protein n=1 Tax=Comamonas terrigena TaxID=32013 RepID=UPI00289FBD8F|nr:tail assembly protein [Comamonas terrigena]